MKQIFVRSVAPLAFVIAVLPFAAGGNDSLTIDSENAQRGLDFEIAREAVARGDILPLAQVLTQLQSVHPGRVIEVELEFSDGALVYEVELVTLDGRLIEVELDARTGEILDLEEDDDD